MVARYLGVVEAVGSSPATRTTSEQALYRLLRFFIKIRARSRRCSSFPRKAGGFAGTPNIGCISLAAYFFAKAAGARTPMLLLCAKSHACCFWLASARNTPMRRYQLFTGCVSSNPSEKNAKIIFFIVLRHNRQTCFKGKNEAGLSLFIPQNDDSKEQIAL